MSEWSTIQCEVTARINQGLAIFECAEEKYPLLRPKGIVRRFALYSGGNDSMCSTNLAMENGWADEVIHIDTGIGIPETHRHAEFVMSNRGWPHRTIKPPDWSYRDMVLRRGFPGPAAHKYAYVWLKERAIAKLVRETKKKRFDRIALITGVRNRESTRRMGYTIPIIRIDARVWVAPLFSWSKADCQEYMTYYNLPRNPVSDLLGYSGECLCGAFAKPKEIKIIEKWWPETAIKIHLLEQEAAKAGKHCVWGTRPPKEKFMDELPFMPMCAGCLSDHKA